MSELKRCPFCGGPARLLKGSDYSRPFYFVMCCWCHNQTFENDCEAIVIDAWNNRPEHRELELCPFCGGEAHVSYEEVRGQLSYAVHCGTCTGSMRGDDWEAPCASAEEAIRNWNRRVKDVRA